MLPTSPYNSQSPYSSLANRFQAQNQYFSCFIQDGKILTPNAEGNTQVGVTNNIYNDLKNNFDSLVKIAEQYKAKLIELGEIKEELSQEEVINKQNEMIKEQTKQMSEISKLLAESQKSQKELLSALTEIKESNENVRSSLNSIEIDRTGPKVDETGGGSMESSKDVSGLKGRAAKGS